MEFVKLINCSTVLERVIRYVTNLEKFIREAKELRTK